MDAKTIRDFAEAASSGAKARTTQARGTAKVSGGKAYVQLAGSTALTPVESTVTVNDGDELLVRVDDHKAVVIGNITSKALDTTTFYTLLEDGSLDIAVNDLTVNAGGSFVVTAGGQVSFNDRLTLTEDGELVINADGITVSSGGSVNIDDKIILDEDGNLTLAVDSFSLGGSAGIDDLDALKGEDGKPGKDGAPGKDGKDGADGVDVTSQYVVFKSYDYSYDSAGLNVTYKANDVSGYHTNVSASGFRIMNGGNSLLSIKAYSSQGAELSCAAGSSIWMDANSVTVNGSGGIVADSAAIDGTVHCDDVSASNRVTADYLNTSNPQESSSAKANCRIATKNQSPIKAGDIIFISGGGSLRKWKHDIDDLHSDSVAADKLYEIPVRQFIYNDDYLSERDEKRGMTLPGFIAEEVAEIYPAAAVYDEAGDLENWEERYLIPGMLKLIQDQHRQIDDLAARVAVLEGGQNEGA